MPLTPLDDNRWAAIHTWASSDRPEVYPCGRKRPFSQKKMTVPNRFHTFPNMQHRLAESYPQHPAAFPELTTEIEYP